MLPRDERKCKHESSPAELCEQAVCVLPSGLDKAASCRSGSEGTLEEEQHFASLPGRNAFRSGKAGAHYLQTMGTGRVTQVLTA